MYSAPGFLWREWSGMDDKSVLLYSGNGGPPPVHCEGAQRSSGAPRGSHPAEAPENNCGASEGNFGIEQCFAFDRNGIRERNELANGVRIEGDEWSGSEEIGRKIGTRRVE